MMSIFSWARESVKLHTRIDVNVYWGIRENPGSYILRMNIHLPKKKAVSGDAMGFESESFQLPVVFSTPGGGHFFVTTKKN